MPVRFFSAHGATRKTRERVGYKRSTDPVNAARFPFACALGLDFAKDIVYVPGAHFSVTMPSQFCKQCSSCLRLTYNGRNQDEIDTGTVVARAIASINNSVRRKCSCSRRAHRVSAISPLREAWFRRRVLSNTTNNSRGHLLLLKRG